MTSGTIFIITVWLVFSTIICIFLVINKVSEYIEEHHKKWDYGYTSEERKFGINSEDYWFEPNLINKENAKIQEFDEIITAEDGNIIIYAKGKDY
jgi:hypothetical protein